EVRALEADEARRDLEADAGGRRSALARGFLVRAGEGDVERGGARHDGSRAEHVGDREQRSRAALLGIELAACGAGRTELLELTGGLDPEATGDRRADGEGAGRGPGRPEPGAAVRVPGDDLLFDDDRRDRRLGQLFELDREPLGVAASERELLEVR